MINFFFSGIFWVLAMYGLIEIIKEIYYLCVCTKLKSNGIYIIIAAKDEENKIEGFIRSLLFKVICNNEDYINNIIFTDLNSKDETGKIMENLTKEYKEVRFLKWKNCKELIEDIDKT
ncbi:MAG: glycosyltransferase [Clostridiales bacterium]|nr:glycosyltransferase [Clostridiales bacterium]